MKIKIFIEIEKYKLISNTENNRDIRLYNFKNVLFTGLSYYYPDILFYSINYDFLILPIKEKSLSLNKENYYEENNMF